MKTTFILLIVCFSCLNCDSLQEIAFNLSAADFPSNFINLPTVTPTESKDGSLAQPNVSYKINPSSDTMFYITYQMVFVYIGPNKPDPKFYQNLLNRDDEAIPFSLNTPLLEVRDYDQDLFRLGLNNKRTYIILTGISEEVQNNSEIKKLSKLSLNLKPFPNHFIQNIFVKITQCHPSRENCFTCNDGMVQKGTSKICTCQDGFPLSTFSNFLTSKTYLTCQIKNSRCTDYFDEFQTAMSNFCQKCPDNSTPLYSALPYNSGEPSNCVCPGYKRDLFDHSANSRMHNCYNNSPYGSVCINVPPVKDENFVYENLKSVFLSSSRKDFTTEGLSFSYYELFLNGLDLYHIQNGGYTFEINSVGIKFGISFKENSGYFPNFTTNSNHFFQFAENKFGLYINKKDLQNNQYNCQLFKDSVYLCYFDFKIYDVCSFQTYSMLKLPFYIGDDSTGKAVIDTTSLLTLATPIPCIINNTCFFSEDITSNVMLCEDSTCSQPITSITGCSTIYIKSTLLGNNVINYNQEIERLSLFKYSNRVEIDLTSSVKKISTNNIYSAQVSGDNSEEEESAFGLIVMIKLKGVNNSQSYQVIPFTVLNFSFMKSKFLKCPPLINSLISSSTASTTPTTQISQTTITTQTSVNTQTTSGTASQLIPSNSNLFPAYIITNKVTNTTVIIVSIVAGVILIIILILCLCRKKIFYKLYEEKSKKGIEININVNNNIKNNDDKNSYIKEDDCIEKPVSIVLVKKNSITSSNISYTKDDI
jgi:hypothetical protein